MNRLYRSRSCLPEDVYKRQIVTGCLPERYRERLKQMVPRVDAFLGTAAYKDIRKAIEAVVAGGSFSSYPDQTIDETFSKRVLTTVPPTAYVKIAEGLSLIHI